MTADTRAVEACRRYVEAQALVKCLTSQIGTALLSCPLSGKDEFGTDTDGRDAVHVRAAFYDNSYRANLASVCPACAAAYDLIQQRKQARQAFGRAKAMITRIGRGGR